MVAGANTLDQPWSEQDHQISNYRKTESRILRNLLLRHYPTCETDERESFLVKPVYFPDAG
jgi:hypothetical protein